MQAQKSRGKKKGSDSFFGLVVVAPHVRLEAKQLQEPAVSLKAS